MGVWTWTVAGNPVPKARARAGNGHHYTPKRTEDYEAKVRASAPVGLPCLAGQVRIRVTFYRKDAQPCDLDNLCKSVLDGLNRRAFKDDRQVVWLEAMKVIDRENPRAEVEIAEVEANPDREEAAA